mmetsp:Transcript_8035/g.11642  ORF Transcript_8035/g.11642 Transcript_8035/m.11642 type:complete len:336 (+) Transcript_8035:90-1097(+)
METEKTPLFARQNSGVLNKTPNVLVLYRLNDFQKRANINFWLALVSLICCGINIVLFVLNHLLNDHGGSSSKEVPAVSDETFHLVEFWTTFVYALVDACALITSPRSLLSIHKNIWTLKILFFFNVVASLVPALLVSLDLEFFEHIAHELEYINEFSLSLVSLILFTSLTNPKIIMADNNQQEGESHNYKKNSIVVWPVLSVGLSIVIAAVTFLVYNFGAEVYAHYFEFCFNTLSCLVTFWFCMDNRFVAEMEIAQILYGDHTTENCTICDANVILLEQRYNLQYFLQQRASGGLFGSSVPYGMEDNNNTSNKRVMSDGFRRNSCKGVGCEVLND